ncbi:MAG: hypothetical protein J07HQX50_02067, partial [Haloquadratum sp. J07HQX50]
SDPIRHILMLTIARIKLDYLSIDILLQLQAEEFRPYLEHEDLQLICSPDAKRLEVWLNR